MQKGHYFYIILMLAAAIVLGSALGLASNFHLIVERANYINEQKQDGTQKTLSENVPAHTSDAQDPAMNVSSTNPNIDDSLSELLPSDRIEIEAMLKDLTDNSNDYTTNLSNFQKNNSLQPTGQLDYETLDLLLKEAKLKRASELASLN